MPWLQLIEVCYTHNMSNKIKDLLFAILIGFAPTLLIYTGAPEFVEMLLDSILVTSSATLVIFLLLLLARKGKSIVLKLVYILAIPSIISALFLVYFIGGFIYGIFTDASGGLLFYIMLPLLTISTGLLFALFMALKIRVNSAYEKSQGFKQT